MKKQLLLFIMMLLPMVASADAVEINGIYYNLISKGHVAEVTKKPSGKYTGCDERQVCRHRCNRLCGCLWDLRFCPLRLYETSR